MSSDETLLAEALGEEREKNVELKREMKREINKRDKQISILNWKLRGRRVFQFTAGAILALALVSGLGYICWKGLNSYDTNECYIERGSQQVQVYQIHRKVEWGEDKSVGYSTDLDKAREIAKKQGCKLPAER